MALYKTNYPDSRLSIISWKQSSLKENFGHILNTGEWDGDGDGEVVYDTTHRIIIFPWKGEGGRELAAWRNESSETFKLMPKY